MHRTIFPTALLLALLCSLASCAGQAPRRDEPTPVATVHPTPAPDPALCPAPDPPPVPAPMVANVASTSPAAAAAMPAPPPAPRARARLLHRAGPANPRPVPPAVAQAAGPRLPPLLINGQSTEAFFAARPAPDLVRMTQHLLLALGRESVVISDRFDPATAREAAQVLAGLRHNKPSIGPTVALFNALCRSNLSACRTVLKAGPALLRVTT